LSLSDNSLYAVRQAMAQGLTEKGQIVIQAKRTGIRDRLQQPTGRQLIAFVISDNGTGAPKQCEGRIGVPGFTTKEDYGSGFGLCAANEYVQSVGGNLQWENHPGSGFVVDRGFRNTVANCRSYDATKYGVLIQGAAQSGYNQIDTFTAYSPTWEVLKIDAAKNICMNIKGYNCARNGVEIMDDGDENTISGAHITDMVANNPLKINVGATRNFITGFNMYGNSADANDAGTNTMWGTNVDKDGNVDTDVEP